MKYNADHISINESHESENLTLHIMNTGHIYKNVLMPTIRSIEKHFNRDDYDEEKALQALYRITTQCAKKYAKEYAEMRAAWEEDYTKTGAPWYEIFDTDARRAAAIHILSLFFYEEF